MLDGIQLQHNRPPTKTQQQKTDQQVLDLNDKFNDVALDNNHHKQPRGDDASTLSMMSNAVMSDKKNDYTKIINCFPQLKRVEEPQVNQEIMEYMKEFDR